MQDFSLRHLPDAAVLHELVAATSADRASLAAHLARIAEFDRRRLYLEHACSSMYRYCVERLRMSEDAAVQRIRAARTAFEHPAIFPAIAEGRLNISTVLLVSGRLTKANAADLLAAAQHKTSKQVRRLLAERFGRQGVPGRAVVPAPQPGAEPASEPASESAAAAPDLPVLKRVKFSTAEPEPPQVPLLQWPLEASPLEAPPRRARPTPVGPGVFELVALLGEESCARLEAPRDLLGHAVPSGDLAEVLERAIALQYTQLLKRRCGATDRPRAGVGDGADNGTRAAEGPDVAAPCVPTNPRYIPNAVLREVWERDGGQCTFTSADGHRCDERFRVEIDHIVPVARGGLPTAENLRLLCRAHNQFVAERALGREHVRARRDAAQRARTEERLRKQAERERTGNRRNEIEQQRDEVGEAFHQLGYRGRDLECALAYCASRAEASLEERLKYALGCMAPRVRRESPAPCEQALSA